MQGLKDIRTLGLKDIWTLGLKDFRILGLKDSRKSSSSPFRRGEGGNKNLSPPLRED
jgi:hypothetical protein